MTSAHRTIEAQPRRRRAPQGAGLGVVMSLPAVLLLAIFLIWPVVTAGQYSVTSASGFGDMAPVGGANFAQVLHDTAFFAAFLRNIVFAAIVVAMSVTVGSILAYLLYMRVGGWRPLQVLLMVPYVLPVVVTGLLWQFLLEPTSGLVNTALRTLGLPFLAGPWLTSDSTALGSVSLVQAWVTIPFAMLLIFGGMLAIPTELLEAADLDGASHFTKLTRVVLPIIRPTIVLVVFVLTVQLFRSFDLVYILTQGGPLDSTTIATLDVFVTGFVDNQYGYANAMGIIIGILLVLIAATPAVVAWVRRRRSALGKDA